MYLLYDILLSKNSWLSRKELLLLATKIYVLLQRSVQAVNCRGLYINLQTERTDTIVLRDGRNISVKNSITFIWQMFILGSGTTHISLWVEAKLLTPLQDTVLNRQFNYCLHSLVFCRVDALCSWFRNTEPLAKSKHKIIFGILPLESISRYLKQTTDSFIKTWEFAMI